MLKSFDLDVETWETLALDRPAWRSKVNKRTALFEQNRIAGAQRKHELRKSKAISLTPAQEIHQSTESREPIEYSSKPLEHSIAKRVLVFKR